MPSTPQLRLVIPLFVSNGNFTSTLVLVSGAAVNIYADVVLCAPDGREIVRQRVNFAPHSQQKVDVGSLLASVVSGVTWGSILVMPDATLGGPSILGQLTMNYVGAQYQSFIDEEIAMPSQAGSQVLRAVSDPGEGSPRVAITSLAQSVQHVSIECIGSSQGTFSKSMELGAGQTVLTEACDGESGGNAGILTPAENGGANSSHAMGIALTTDGMPGSYAAFALTPHKADGGMFFTSVTFTDPKMLMSPNTVFAGVPVGATPLLTGGEYTPELSLANFSKRDAHVTVVDAVTPGSAPSATMVQSLVVPAMTSTKLTIHNLQGQSDLQNSFVVQSDGAPGEVLAKLVSRGDSDPRPVELEAKDAMETNNGGSHPWSLENNTESTLLLFNHTSSAQPFHLLLAGGSSIWQKAYQVAPMQTLAISIQDLIRNQAKDDHGNTLPTNALSGEVGWWTPNVGVGTGRILQSDLTTGMARNFSCSVLRGLCGVNILQYETTLLNGSIVDFAEAVDLICEIYAVNQCGGVAASTTVGGYNTGWSSEQPAILAISGSASQTTVSVQGMSPGTAQINAQVKSQYCSANGGVPGKVQAPTSLSGPVLDGGTTYTGQPLTDCSGKQRVNAYWGYRYCGTYTVLDQNGAPIRKSGIALNETITVVQSSGGNPTTITGSATTNASGQFLDSLAFGFPSPPPPQPGDFVTDLQTITVTGQANPIRKNCIKMTSTPPPTVSNITSAGTCP